MVDLMNQYQQAGLQIDCRELPDHLPLYLEYLSILPPAEAREGLQNIAPILALIGGRLKQRACPYYQLFDALLALAKARSPVTVSQNRWREKSATIPVRRWTPWEEEQVKFIEDNATACDSSSMQAYQRRFSQDVAPQYVDIRAGGPK